MNRVCCETLIITILLQNYLNICMPENEKKKKCK